MRSLYLEYLEGCDWAINHLPDRDPDPPPVAGLGAHHRRNLGLRLPRERGPRRVRRVPRSRESAPS